MTKKSVGVHAGFRQEVFNVLLAQLLCERGIVSAPEDVLASTEGRRMPDVLVDFSGLRTAIEGEVADQPKASEKAIASATKRVEQGIAQVGLAVVYPAELRHKPFPDLKSSLGTSSLQVAVATEAGASGFADSSVDGLAGILRGAFDQLVQENAVSEAVAHLEAGIETFASAVSAAPGIVPRLADVLGIRELPKAGAKDEEETDQEETDQEEESD